MVLYRLRGLTYMISGAHKSRLPAAKCRNECKCTAGWGDAALAYPQLEIPTHLPRSEYRLRFPLSWKEYEQLRDMLRKSIGSGLPLPPGTKFGPLRGDVTGPPTDFAWVWDWSCFVRKEVLPRLGRALERRIKTAPTEIRSRRKEKPVYVEIVALPTALVTSAVERELPPFHCGICGNQFASDGYFAYADTNKVQVAVKRSSIPEDTCIFRIRQLSRWLLCTEEFHDAVLDLGLSNIRFEPVPLANE
jgi:uncharacterized double-CXXCG motif protein